MQNFVRRICKETVRVRRFIRNANLAGRLDEKIY